MSSYTNTLIQVLSASSSLNNLYLKLGPGLDSLTNTVQDQSQATRYNILNTGASFERAAWTLAEDDNNVSTAFADILGHDQQILWGSAARERAESSTTGTLRCGAFPAADNASGPNDRLECMVAAASPFQYSSGWAICDDILGYSRGALFIFDTGLDDGAPPKGCTVVDLKIVNA